MRPVIDSYADARDHLARAQQLASFFGATPRFVIEMVFILGIAVLCAVIFVQTSTTQATVTLALFVMVGFQTLPSYTRQCLGNQRLACGRAGVGRVLPDIHELPIVDAPDTDAERTGFSVQDPTISWQAPT